MEFSQLQAIGNVEYKWRNVIIYSNVNIAIDENQFY